MVPLPASEKGTSKDARGDVDADPLPGTMRFPVVAVPIVTQPPFDDSSVVVALNDSTVLPPTKTSRFVPVLKISLPLPVPN